MQRIDPNAALADQLSPDDLPPSEATLRDSTAAEEDAGASSSPTDESPSIAEPAPHVVPAQMRRQPEQTFRLEVLTQEPLPGANEETPVLPDLLFVHGAWHGAWCWARFQALCAQLGFRSHAVNLRGHGGSSGHEQLARCRLDDYVADVAQVARELTTPFILIGHSLGGVVAQRYLTLLDHGQELPRPAGVALLASALPADMATAFRNPRVAEEYGGRLCSLGMFLKAWLTGDTTPFVGTPQRVRSLLFTFDTPTQEILDCFIRLQNESMSAINDVRRFARVWQPPQARQVPILVLGGAQDKCFGPVVSKRLAAAYGATLDVFIGIGHDLMLDRGWEQVAYALVGWVRALPSLAVEEDQMPTEPDRQARVIPLRPLPMSYASPRDEFLAATAGRHGRADTTDMEHGRERFNTRRPRGSA